MLSYSIGAQHLSAMDNPPFTLTEAHAIHHAFTEAMEDAKSREGTSPTSAAAIRAIAANILSVRDKILATLPEHHRKNYPPLQIRVEERRP